VFSAHLTVYTGVDF